MTATAMQLCDIWELARREGEVSGELPLARAARLAEELYDADGTLRYHLRGHRDAQGRAAASLRLEGRLRLRCDRCGGPLELPINEQAEFFFVADEAELARLPIDDAQEEALLGSNRFDVQALIEDQAILALPFSPRHDDCSPPSPPDDAADEDGSGSRRPFEALAALKRRKQ